MSKTNWQIEDPISKRQRIVVITIDARGWNFDFDARFSDAPDVLIAGGTDVANTEAATLAIAKRLVADARTI